jgi:hypothetical protein
MFKAQKTTTTKKQKKNQPQINFKRFEFHISSFNPIRALLSRFFIYFNFISNYKLNVIVNV